MEITLSMYVALGRTRSCLVAPNQLDGDVCTLAAVRSWYQKPFQVIFIINSMDYADYA